MSLRTDSLFPSAHSTVFLPLTLFRGSLVVSRWLVNLQLSPWHLKTGIIDGDVLESGHENSHTPLTFYKKQNLPSEVNFADLLLYLIVQKRVICPPQYQGPV